MAPFSTVLFSSLAVVAPTVCSAKADVRIFLEAGCPYCSKYLSGPLARAIDDKEVAASMTVDLSPFGNAYFLTEECRAEATQPAAWTTGEYDVGLRNCFNKKCGAGATSRPADCFSGKLICQHGPRECAFNRYLACAKHISPKQDPASMPYLPFFTCMESAYGNGAETEPPVALLSSCAQTSSLAIKELQSCYQGTAGDEVISGLAMTTPEHPGVPLVLIDGRPLEESYEPDALVHAVRGEKSLLAISDQRVSMSRFSNKRGGIGFLAPSESRAANMDERLMC